MIAQSHGLNTLGDQRATGSAHAPVQALCTTSVSLALGTEVQQSSI
jgi:hypothetical protein